MVLAGEIQRIGEDVERCEMKSLGVSAVRHCFFVPCIRQNVDRQGWRSCVRVLFLEPPILWSAVNHVPLA
jgi:hypothetical protein